MTMSERMTICNMSIEAGARAGMIAPDDTTYEFGGAGIFDRITASAADADLRDYGEDDVFGGDPKTELSIDLDAKRARAALPNRLRRHHVGRFRCADAEGQIAERWGISTAALGSMNPFWRSTITCAVLANRAFAPKGQAWDEALKFWRTLPSEVEAKFGKEVEIDAGWRIVKMRCGHSVMVDMPRELAAVLDHLA
jgi:homoaconitase/3-isopropylmalate dehydratase large subunit